MQKMYLTQRQIDWFREMAKDAGHSMTWFDRWLEECVGLLVPMDEELPKGTIINGEFVRKKDR